MLPPQGVGVGVAPPVPGGAPDLTKRASVPAAACDVALRSSREAIAPLMVPLPCGEGLPALHAVVNAPASTGRFPPVVPQTSATAAGQTGGLEVTLTGPVTATLVICVADTARMVAQPGVGRAALRVAHTGAGPLGDAARATGAPRVTPEPLHATGRAASIAGAR